MPKLSPISSRELIHILEKSGFIQVRQKGSHIRMEHIDGRKTTIPSHTGEKIGVCLLRKILRHKHITHRV